jgi:hypothetical protein
MKPLTGLIVLGTLIAGVCLPAGAEEADGYKPLFNGKNLKGWVNVNCAPNTFFVRGDEIITTGNPTGYLRTDKQYENFALELDWMHVNTKEVGNSGVFVWGDPLPAVGTGYTRGIEVQVLVNLTWKDKNGALTATSQGDLFSIWGAKCVPDRPHPSGWERCLPSSDHTKGGGEWNHYKVVGNDGVIKLSVNGFEVSGISKCVPRKGYLALESEGAECHFKNLKIKELPSTSPTPAETADVDQGSRSLFDGLTLDGWDYWTPPGHTSDHRWKAGGGHLKAGGSDYLSTKKEFGPCELVVDWKAPPKVKQELVIQIGGHKQTVSLPADGKPGDWHRATLKAEQVAGASPIQILPAPGLELMNLFVRELK